MEVVNGDNWSYKTCNPVPAG